MSDAALRILFIDDEQAVLDGIARVLRTRHPDWVTRFVSEPLEALKVYARMQGELQVVVCDINMPQVSGLQIMRAVKERTPGVAVIALTGQLDIQSLKGIQKYADAHLCKPVDIEALSAAILAAHQRGTRPPS